MKIRNAVLIILFAATALFGQTFKEVKTAQDVVDNYIEANGGKDELSAVKSIYMKGDFTGEGHAGSLEIYMGKNYFYLNLDLGVFKMKQAVDIKNGKGWTQFGDMTKDMNEDELKKNRKNAEGTLWAYYIDPVKYGIKYNLLPNEKVAEKDAYAVELQQEGAAIITAYFDAKTFDKVRQVKGNDDSEFSDFREVGTTKVRMPYTIKGKNGDVAISELKFNSKFEKKLLTKPEVEK